MQSHEERADEMLRIMGGALTEHGQRNALRRLILAEDKVAELEAERASWHECYMGAVRTMERSGEESDDTRMRLYAYIKENVRLSEVLTIATDALRDIGGRDIIRASEIAWAALEQIEGSDEVIGEALERQRQPENQPDAGDN